LTKLQLVCRLPDRSPRIPARSARETNSARDWTCIFSITLWRWALIVRSVAPNTLPTCLLVLPRMMSSKTSRSRGVSLAICARTVSSSSRWLRAARWFAKARSTAARRSSLRSLPSSTGVQAPSGRTRRHQLYARAQAKQHPMMRQVAGIIPEIVPAGQVGRTTISTARVPAFASDKGREQRDNARSILHNPRMIISAGTAARSAETTIRCFA
jgi:hypothetical protein